MVFPTQQFIHDPENGSVGDCWRACIAGLLGLPIEEVPHFVRDFEEPDWWEATRRFVRDHSPGDQIDWYDPTFPAYIGDGWPVVILSGPSPRGDWMHSVLADSLTGEVVWDPHPSRAGLAGPATDMAAVSTMRHDGEAE